MNRRFRYFLLGIMMFISGSVSAQTDTIPPIIIDQSYPDTWLHPWAGPRFARLEKSIGLVPSIQGFNDLYIGLGVSKARFMVGEGGGSALSTTIGVEYNPIDQVVAPKLNFQAAGLAYFFGGNVGISGLYYMWEGDAQFVLRPEIGIGFLVVYLNYGYNFFLPEGIPGTSRHVVTLSYYQTLFTGGK